MDSERGADSMVYSDECRRRFEAPAHAGPPGQGDTLRGTARGREGDTEVVLWLARDPRAAWFQAHGCPWTIAGADLAAELWTAGREKIEASDLAKGLGAPPEKMDVFLTIEDACRAALNAGGGNVPDGGSDVDQPD